MKPTVAVVIPTHNRPHLLPRALRSVLTQTISVSVVISDDGTEVPALDIVEKFREEFGEDRITYVKTKGNEGPPTACDYGAENTNAEFISFLADDDEFTTAGIEKMLAPLVEHEDVDIVIGSVLSIYTQDGVVVRDSICKPAVPSGVPIAPNDFMEDLLTSRVRMEAYLVRHDAMKAIGRRDVRFWSSDAVDFAVRMCLRGGGGYCIDHLVLNKYTRLEEEHAGSIDKKIFGRELFLEKHFELFRKYPLIHSKHYFELASLKRVFGDVNGARKAFFKAWFYNKSNLQALIRATVLLFGMRVYLFFRGVLNKSNNTV